MFEVHFYEDKQGEQPVRKPTKRLPKKPNKQSETWQTTKKGMNDYGNQKLHKF